MVPSVASSDAERLAAGISTIGLKTKRLPGTERKRLTRERKMRVETWTEKKPQGKAPSTQSKDEVGCSGGVKGFHSDSSTPPFEEQQIKKLGTLRYRLGRTKKLLLESRWRLFTDATLPSTGSDSGRHDSG